MTTKVWKMGMAVDQLIADTVDLSDKEFGKYVRMLCYAWKNKARLDASRFNYIDRIDNISKDSDTEMTQYLLNRYFEYDQDGQFYYNTAQTEEWERVKKVSNSNTKSANDRWDTGENALKTQSERNTSNSYSKSNRNSNNNKKKYIDLFNEFWRNVQNKVKKGQAETTFIKLINDFAEENMSPKELADLYNKHCNSQTDMKFAQHPSTWLNAKGYLDKPMSKETRDEFGVVPQKKSLENYVNFVKKGVHTTFIDDTMVKQMLVKGLITEEEFKAW